VFSTTFPRRAARRRARARERILLDWPLESGFASHVAEEYSPSGSLAAAAASATSNAAGIPEKDVLSLSRGISARDALACCRSNSNKLKKTVLSSVNGVLDALLNPPSSSSGAQLALFMPGTYPEREVFRPPASEPITFKPPPNEPIRIEWTRPFSGPLPGAIVLVGAVAAAKWLTDALAASAALGAAAAMAEVIQRAIEDQGTCEECLRPKVWGQDSQRVQLDLPRKSYRKRPRDKFGIPNLPKLP